MAGERSPRARHTSRWSSIERELRREGGSLIAGVDEVGRGSLAGPVVACAIVMPPDVRAIAGVDDSKRLTPQERVRLARHIRGRALAIAVGGASSREVDRINIYHASVLAIRRALQRLPLRPDHVLIDGRPIRTLGMDHRAVVRGDDRCYNVACASIIAKVTRDRLMSLLARRYPAFLWERNCGYSTPEHVSALGHHGPTPHHRRSFIVKGLAVVGDDQLDQLDDAPADAPCAGDAAGIGADLVSMYEMEKDGGTQPERSAT